MTDDSERLRIAPSLGTLAEGIDAFRTARPPYYRGGGDSVTTQLETVLNKYLGGTHCVIAPSGQAANFAALSALLPPGTNGHALISNRLFGTTSTMIKQGFQQAGHEVTFFDPVNVNGLEREIRTDTKVIFTETSSNPEGVVPNLNWIASLARNNDFPLVLDHTLTAGFDEFNPFEYADIVTVSLAKQSGGGFNRSSGGVILLDAGFDWHRNQSKFAGFSRYFMESGKVILPAQPFGTLLRKNMTWLGSCISPVHNAEEIMDSLPGLSSRVSMMRSNAAKLAKYLRNHEKVERVLLAGTDDSENSARAKEYLGGNGFVLFLDLKGGAEAAGNFINQMTRDKIISHSVQLGQQQTAVVVPGFTTNRQATDADLEARGMGRHSIRISVGVERPEIIRQQFEKVLGF